MNYDFSEAEFLLVVQIDGVLRDLVPQGSQPDAKNADPFLRTVLGALARTPYLRLGVEPVAGLNGLVSLTAAMEAVAAICPDLCLAVETSARVFGRILAAWAGPEQKRRWLGPLLDGAAIGTLAMSEETLNVENDPFHTTARIEADQVVISGRKQLVINGPVADTLAVVGTLEGRPVVFLVDADTEGLIKGPHIATLGYEGAAFCTVELEHCRIGRDQVVDPGTPAMVDTIRLWENQVITGISLGLMKTGFEAARDHAKTHRSGGKPVIAYQQVGFKLAEMLTVYQSAQLLAYRAAWTADAAPKDAQALALCAKVFATETAEQVTGAALQILAGAGIAGNHRVARAWRCAKYGQIAGTSTEIARVKIGDDALGT